MLLMLHPNQDGQCTEKKRRTIISAENTWSRSYALRISVQRGHGQTELFGKSSDSQSGGSYTRYTGSCRSLCGWTDKSTKECREVLVEKMDEAGDEINGDILGSFGGYALLGCGVAGRMRGRLCGTGELRVPAEDCD
jgi:hypothetical protein